MIGRCCLREYESISVDPIRVLRVEGHEFVEEDVGHGGHAHGGAGMAGVRFESGIDLNRYLKVSNERSMVLSRREQSIVMVHADTGTGFDWWGWASTHSEQSNSIDGKLIVFAVTHDGGGGIQFTGGRFNGSWKKEEICRGRR